MWHPDTVGAVSQTNGTNWAVERDAGDHQGSRGGIDGQNVVGVFLVGREDRANDLDFVTEALGERRTQWTVDQTTDEYGLVGRLAFTTEVRTWDFSGGVGTLFNIHGQWEEVDSVTYAAVRRNGGQKHRVANASGNGTVSELRQLSGFEGQGLVSPSYGARNAHGVGHVFFLCLGYEHAESNPSGQGSELTKPSPPASEDDGVHALAVQPQVFSPG